MFSSDAQVLPTSGPRASARGTWAQSRNGKWGGGLLKFLGEELVETLEDPTNSPEEISGRVETDDERGTVV